MLILGSERWFAQDLHNVELRLDPDPMLEMNPYLQPIVKELLQPVPIE